MYLWDGSISVIAVFTRKPFVQGQIICRINIQKTLKSSLGVISCQIYICMPCSLVYLTVCSIISVCAKEKHYGQNYEFLHNHVTIGSRDNRNISVFVLIQLQPTVVSGWICRKYDVFNIGPPFIYSLRVADIII